MTLREEILRNSGILVEMPVKKLEDARLFVEWGYLSFKIDNSKVTLVEKQSHEFTKELIEFINGADKINYFWGSGDEELNKISCNIDNKLVANFRGEIAKTILSGIIKKVGKRNLISFLSRGIDDDNMDVVNAQINYVKGENK